MMKYLILIIIVNVFFQHANAQRNEISELEIASSLNPLKQSNRKIVYEKKFFYENKTGKCINPIELTKDSLRHFLVDHGFYDYDFKCFQLNIKNLEELNDTFIKNQHPTLYKLLHDSLFNKLSFNFKNANDELIIDAILSKNFVKIDDSKEGKAVIGAGYYKEEITFNGSSNVSNIYYSQNDNFSTIEKQVFENRKPVSLNDSNRFSITIDVSSHKSNYVAISRDTGDTLAIIKIY